ncbi:MAG: hypothetical protein JKY17_08420 [Magnetovibrio sp.]|nr:hypothetical protein [Magnetovibrio sp.]
MGRCSDAFGKLYKELGISLSLNDLGQLAAEVYNDVVTTTQDPDEQRIVIKGLASRHRREILTETTANTSGKRTAS